MDVFKFLLNEIIACFICQLFFIVNILDNQYVYLGLNNFEVGFCIIIDLHLLFS